MTDLIFDRALTPEGWASNVRIGIADGRITTLAADADPAGAERVAGHALPGLPNLHCHAFQRGMAGLAERRGHTADSFWTWREVMYRFLDALTPEDVEAIAAQAYVEMLEGGFTANVEFHYLHHAADGSPYADLAELAGRHVAAAGRTGIGLTMLPVLYTYGGFGGAAPSPGQRRFINDVDRYLALREAARRHVARLPDARLGFAPHSLRAVTPESLAAALKGSTDGPVHIHAAEQVKEVEDCLAWSGQRPVEWLVNHAADSRWCLVHATQMTPVETERLARSGAIAGLCPLTEANLGDGIFPGEAYRAAGGAIGVGSDSNIEITAPGELKMFEYSLRLAAKGRNLYADSGASTGRSLYDAALAGGARAAGRDIGALAVGKRADIVVLDPGHVDIDGRDGDAVIDAYVFSAGKTAIDRVVVGGATVVRGGAHKDRETVAAAYRKVLKRILAQ